MLLVGMPRLLVSFASITRNMFAANAVPVFCSRMVQDIKTILTALGAGTEAIYQVHVPSFIQSAAPSSQANGCFYFCKAAEIWKAPY